MLQGREKKYESAASTRLINLIFSYYQEEQTEFAIFNSEILTYRIMLTNTQCSIIRKDEVNCNLTQH